MNLISKNTHCTCSTLFFSNQQKNKFAGAARFFVFLCRCFAQLVTHYFYGGIVVYAYPIFFLRSFCSGLITEI